MNSDSQHDDIQPRWAVAGSLKRHAIVACRSARLAPRRGSLRKVCLALAVLSGVAAASALAAGSGSPTIEAFSARNVFATRAELMSSGRTQIEPTRVRWEYATSSKGPWAIGCEVANVRNSGQIVEPCVLHHLTPEEHYIVRIVAENTAGSAEATTEFTTTSVTAPEVLSLEVTNNAEHEQVLGVHYAEVGTCAIVVEQCANLETNGLETKYHFEYGTSQSGPWTTVSGCSGTITVAEDFADPRCRIENLESETTYYAKLIAENARGTSSKVIQFETKSGKPIVNSSVIDAGVTNVTPTSVTLHDMVIPQSVETHWRFEYATSEAGPWSKGPGGVISGAEADERRHQIAADLTGLSATTTYYLRFVAENEYGSGVSQYKEGEAPHVTSIETAGQPLPSAFPTHTFAPHASEAIRVLGAVRPDVEPLNEVQTVTLGGTPSGGTFTLSFEGQTTAPIPYDASEAEVKNGLAGLSTVGESNIAVSGRHGGPYRIEFVEKLGGSDRPQMTSDASGLTPAGTVDVATVHNGSTPDTHYHVEYIGQREFEEAGWSGSAKTAELDAGPGGLLVENIPFNGGSRNTRAAFSSSLIAVDLPLLKEGETYRYRLVASNESGVATSAERTFSVPAVAGASGEEACPNQKFRAGPSTRLPDCRAYEQVTPANKENSEEIARYGLGASGSGEFAVGADGNHVLIESNYVKWQPSPGSVVSNYLLSRAAGGWTTSSAAPQPQAGLTDYYAWLRSPDLTQVGVQTGWATGPFVITPRNQSSAIEMAAGPFGGPYTTAASIPRSQLPGEGHTFVWVAASADFSRLVLRTDDHRLLGAPTGTLKGYDLFEYANGRLSQANAMGTKTIGRCGANMVKGFEGYSAGLGSQVGPSSPDAVSGNGHRLFFEAAPGSNCSEAKHLYMRVDGEQTVDLGQYRFLAANPAGTKLIVEHANGSSYEASLYETESETATPLFTTSEPIGSGGGNYLTISEDASAMYFISSHPLTAESPAPETEYHDLYRYDVPARALSYVAQIQQNGGASPGMTASPDGRYLYFTSLGVAGVPGGSGSHSSSNAVRPEDQDYRYDSTEGVIQCVACVSPFQPEPKLASVFMSPPGSADGVPNTMVASANGDYVFFDTAAALVPQDINGEVEPGYSGGEDRDFEHSVSSDVYEWRRDGIGGCSHAQGCVSLISSGVGGFKVSLLGTDASGRDVFFTSRDRLASSDDDNAIDIYDARIGGGFPPPAPRPVECEGDACTNPVGAPIDTTPASLSFSGAGNALTASEVSTARKKPVVKPCKKVKGKKRTCARKRKPLGRHKALGKPKGKRAQKVSLHTTSTRHGGGSK